MNHKIIPALLIGASLFLSACAAPSPNPATSAPKNTTTAGAATEAGAPVKTVSREEYEALQNEKNNEIDALQDEISVLTSENEKLKKGADVTPDNSAIAFSQRLAGLLYFPVYELDENMEAQPSAYVAIKPQATVEEKLAQLSQGISEILFDGRQIKVAAIEDIDGKRVAHIDLVGKDTWYQVFQGTTGGASASQALVTSYLQADYQNAWIDGVRFTLDGEPTQLDHAPIFDETQYRD